MAKKEQKAFICNRATTVYPGNVSRHDQHTPILDRASFWLRRMPVILLSAVLIIFIFTLQSHQKTSASSYSCGTYVPLAPTGSGTVIAVSNQSELTAAISAASPGDTINLATGTYTGVRYRGDEGATSGTAAHPIVIQAANGASPVINPGTVSGGSRAVFIGKADYIKVRGLEVIGGQFGMTAQNTVGVDFEYNTVHGSGDATVAVQAFFNDDTLVSSDSEIVCNVIYDTGNNSEEFSEGVYVGTGSIGKVDATHDVLIKGNTIYNIQNEAIDIKKFTYNITIEDNLIHDITPWYGGAISLGLNSELWGDANYLVQRNAIWNVSKHLNGDYAQAIAIGHGTTTIRNNVIWGIDTASDILWNWRHVIQLHNSSSTDDSAYGFGNNTYKTVYLYNNTIWGCEEDCINAFSDSGTNVPDVISTNNLVSSLSGGVVSASTDHLADGSDFIGPITNAADAGAGDGAGSGFALAASSSALNNGTTVAGFSDDFFGTIRPNGAAWDSGAFEYVETALDDGDGIDNALEDASPNNGDYNNDGNLDSEQSNVATIVNTVISSSTPNSYAALVSPAGSTISEFDVLDDSEIPKKDAEYDNPLGWFDFTINGVGVGSSNTVVLYLDSLYDTSNWVWRKYTPSTGDFTTVSNVAYATATIGGKTVTTVSYSIVDGGTNDADGAANGILVDPAGPAVKKSALASLANTGNPAAMGLIAAIFLWSSVLFVNRHTRLVTYRLKR